MFEHRPVAARGPPTPLPPMRAAAGFRCSPDAAYANLVPPSALTEAVAVYPFVPGRSSIGTNPRITAAPPGRGFFVLADGAQAQHGPGQKAEKSQEDGQTEITRYPLLHFVTDAAPPQP